MKTGTSISLFFIILVGFSLTFFIQNQSFCQPVQKKIPSNFCVSTVEAELHQMINEYRSRNNLPPIPFSRSLSYVARAHVRDLFFNRPDQGKCNVHSWSDKGPWKPFCYPQDEKKNNSVWDKPKELTPYNSKAYEIVYWENNPVNIDSIMPFWQSIDYFNNFLISAGNWQGRNWQAIGVGIYENYASVWFGEIADPEGEPWICGQEPVKKSVTEPRKKEPVKAVNEQNENVQKIEIRTDTVAKPAIYYIIVSSQQPREKSKSFSSELVSKGYKDAKVLINGNKVRVSIMEFRDKASADSALREVRNLYMDAWIYRQNNP